jgi:UDP-N-acetylmuramate dehydrogenase
VFIRPWARPGRGGGRRRGGAPPRGPGFAADLSASAVARRGRRVTAEAGAARDSLVAFAVRHGLAGIETLARIPGWLGAAVYGNAGAYGHSISERIAAVTFVDGPGLRTIPRQECEFRYRDSVFKRRKDWVIASVDLDLPEGDAAELACRSREIARVRDEKFPPSMKCAGSVFKNLLLADLPPGAAAAVPESVIREGKVPAAWFLEQIGAKGMSRGGIQVAHYHANLLFNAGGGTARDLVALVTELKSRVAERFGIELEEEVQYLGF